MRWHRAFVFVALATFTSLLTVSKGDQEVTWVREWALKLDSEITTGSDLADKLGLMYLGPLDHTNWHSFCLSDASDMQREEKTKNNNNSSSKSSSSSSSPASSSPVFPFTPPSDGPSRSGTVGWSNDRCALAGCDQFPTDLSKLLLDAEESRGGKQGTAEDKNSSGRDEEEEEEFPSSTSGSSVQGRGLPKKASGVDWASLGVIDVEQIEIVSGVSKGGSESVLVPDVAQWTPVDPQDELWLNQWHLRNTGALDLVVAHQDVNVIPAWAAGYKGEGVQIAVIDDGIAWSHVDFGSGKFNELDSVDLRDLDGDPFPPGFGSHGTSVGGLAFAAEDEDGVCGVGVAPKASFSGVRLLGAPFTTSEVALALTYGVADGSVDVSVNSWGPNDSGATEYIGKTIRDAFETGVTQGRGGLGTVYVWAGGNGGSCDNSNLDPYTSLPETLAIGATNAAGVLTDYSERGSNLLINTPSSDSTTGPLPGMTTTAYSSFTNCRNDFGGTSSAAPVAGGAVALLLEANPSLTWRDVKWILALSAEQNDPESDTWNLNGAGFPVSEYYGHGRLNIGTAIANVLTWPGTGIQYTQEWGAANLEEEEGFGGLVWSSTIHASWADLPGNVRDLVVEDAIAHVTMIGEIWRQRDVDIVLKSPSGTTSRLWHASTETGCFSSNSELSGREMYSTHFMGEALELTPGEEDPGWTLYVSDEVNNPGGSFLGELTIFWSLELRAIDDPTENGIAKFDQVGRIPEEGSGECGDGILEVSEACEDPVDGLPSIWCTDECEFACELPVVCGDGQVNAPCEQCDPPDGIYCGPTCRYSLVNDDPENAFELLDGENLGGIVETVLEFNNSVAQDTFGLEGGDNCGSSVLQSDLWFYVPPGDNPGRLDLNVVTYGWSPRWFVWVLGEGLTLEDWNVKAEVPVECPSGILGVELIVEPGRGVLIGVGGNGATEKGAGELLVRWVGECGNGVVNDGEECDPEADVLTDPRPCRDDCTIQRCGDGIIDVGEACDLSGPEGECCTDDCQLCDDTGGVGVDAPVLAAAGAGLCMVLLLGGFVLTRGGSRDDEGAVEAAAVAPGSRAQTERLPEFEKTQAYPHSSQVQAQAQSQSQSQAQPPIEVVPALSPSQLTDDALEASVIAAAIPSPILDPEEPEELYEPGEPAMEPDWVVEQEVGASVVGGSVDLLPPPPVDEDYDDDVVVHDVDFGETVYSGEVEGVQDDDPLDLSLSHQEGEDSFAVQGQHNGAGVPFY